MYPVLARTGEKERARSKKGGEEKKSKGCTLCFYNMATLEIVFGRKDAVGWKSPFAGNLFVNRLEDSAMNSANLSKCTILKWQTTFMPFGINAAHFADYSSRFCRRLVC